MPVWVKLLKHWIHWYFKCHVDFSVDILTEDHHQSYFQSVGGQW